MKRIDVKARGREVMDYMEEYAVSADEAIFSLLLDHAEEFLPKQAFAWGEISCMSKEERQSTYLNLPYEA